MKNYRRALPPLDYLLFFEAVARHGNFTRAAEELNVSQAAVSKRIKVLEDWLGMTLVNRRGRNLSLTRNGKILAANSGEALDYLHSCLNQLRRASTGARLSLAANVAVSQYWLTPRINEYLLSSDAAPVTLTASDKDADLFALEADALIYYGQDIPAGWDGSLLFAERWMPVTSPAKAQRKGGLAAATLLDFDKLTPKWVNWDDFAELTGFAEIAQAAKVNLGSYGSTLDTAIRGRGVALGCPDVLRFEIDAGRLVPLEDYQLITGRSYFVIWRTGLLSEQTRSLLRDAGIPV
ncbi:MULTISPECIES: LysR family transcriptional regulator [unclassified Leisingera]|uniref:LysR family transcriptional regulator n=1 Tax=unclassified Leisingera TaxID=2614906 RepID=UPI001013A2C2|nr:MULTISPECIES: LysR family transcriptional regulator [unclassified Leisingera]MCF6433361.1 LysR family transcriptional regulator [Leisingera sp. MMG026]QAX28766.1 LysR family transcriptional regulator [Leisingera sp. NJS204]